MPKNKTTTTKNTGFFNRLWQGFLTTVGTERFFKMFSPWVKYLLAIALVSAPFGVWHLLRLTTYKKTAIVSSLFMYPWQALP